MKFHIICRVGPNDTFRPNVARDERSLLVPVQHTGNPRRVGEEVLASLAEEGLNPADAAVDLLHAALAAYSADLRVPRSASDDRWMREFVLYLPVLELRRWQRARSVLIKLLTFLTGDRWTLELRERRRLAGQPQAETPRLAAVLPEIVCLFSGGLDSFIGAIDVLGTGRRAALVGHYGYGGNVSFPQSESFNFLRAHFGDVAEHFSFRVVPPELQGKLEPTTRGRSFLFLALGTTVASACSAGIPLVVPENGLISLNIPLTPARSGSLSTRTTHPYLVMLFRNLLKELRIDVDVQLPCRFMTKGEMLKACSNQALLRGGLFKTMSCAHPGVGFRVGGDPKEHCGYCMPCLIRRAALKAARIANAEDYFIDVTVAPPQATSERGEDLRAMQIALGRLRGAPSYRFIFEALKSGPLPGTPADVQDFANVYRRGLEEVRAFLRV
jgi:hypothetical protein